MRSEVSRFRASWRGALVCGLLSACATTAPDVATPVEVVLETTLGEVVIELDMAKAPKAAGYWLGYVDRGQYDGATLYRSASPDGVEPPQLVQGGVLLSALNSDEPIVASDYGVEFLEAFETTEASALQHDVGAVSLARDLLETGHVIPELVVCLRAVPSMNYGARDVPDSRGFPVIGRVVSGMAVIEAASRQALDGPTTIPFLSGQILSEPVTIVRAYRLEVGRER